MNAAGFLLSLRQPVVALIDELLTLVEACAQRAARHHDTVMPVYTHFRPALPSTWGHYLAAVAIASLRDLGAVLDALEGERKNIIYAGHSMGGAVGVLRAGADQRIKALVSLAGMVNTRKFAETEFGEVVPGEGNMWDDDDCPLSQAYMDDLRGIDTLLHKGGEVSVPWMLVHGTEDDVVLIEDTHDIFEEAVGDKQKLIIDGADHVFSQPEHMCSMVEYITFCEHYNQCLCTLSLRKYT